MDLGSDNNISNTIVKFFSESHPYQVVHDDPSVIETVALASTFAATRVNFKSREKMETIYLSSQASIPPTLLVTSLAPTSVSTLPTLHITSVQPSNTPTFKPTNRAPILAPT